MDSAPPNPYRIPVEFSPIRFAILGKSRALRKPTFCRRMDLYGIRSSRSVPAAHSLISLRPQFPTWLMHFAKGVSATALDRIYREISRSIFRKKYFHPGRSVSWYCATARPVGRILAAHEELGTFSAFSNSVLASPRQIETAS